MNTVSSRRFLPVLTPDEWRARMAAHHARIQAVAGAYLRQRAAGCPHPVHDFLFSYYRFRPAHLLFWTPGLSAVLEDPGGAYPLREEFRRENGLVYADPEALPSNRRDGLRWVRALMQAIADRPPTFGCHGLHEWAMVYRQTTVRHAQLPLRLDREEIAKTVERLPVRCSHFDAFRFFTPEARPLNRLQPNAAARMQDEQGGCLHANMDLYKWCHKFWPWTSSELLADTFVLAWDIRILDMRASPYDLGALGFAPVRIETPEGRAEYEHTQRALVERAKPLRRRLISELDRLLAQDAHW